nr:hypothetical protein CFP56_11513 [Quercus suber]
MRCAVTDRDATNPPAFHVAVQYSTLVCSSPPQSDRVVALFSPRCDWRGLADPFVTSNHGEKGSWCDCLVEPGLAGLVGCEKMDSNAFLRAAIHPQAMAWASGSPSADAAILLLLLLLSSLTRHGGDMHDARRTRRDHSAQTSRGHACTLACKGRFHAGAKTPVPWVGIGCRPPTYQGVPTLSYLEAAPSPATQHHRTISRAMTRDIPRDSRLPFRRSEMTAPAGHRSAGEFGASMTYQPFSLLLAIRVSSWTKRAGMCIVSTRPRSRIDELSREAAVFYGWCHDLKPSARRLRVESIAFGTSAATDDI